MRKWDAPMPIRSMVLSSGVLSRSSSTAHSYECKSSISGECGGIRCSAMPLVYGKRHVQVTKSKGKSGLTLRQL